MAKIEPRLQSMEGRGIAIKLDVMSLENRIKELEMKLLDPMYLFNKFATNEGLEVLGNRIKDLESEIRRIHYAISIKDDKGAVY